MPHLIFENEGRHIGGYRIRQSGLVPMSWQVKNRKLLVSSIGSSNDRRLIDQPPASRASRSCASGAPSSCARSYHLRATAEARLDPEDAQTLQFPRIVGSGQKEGAACNACGRRAQEELPRGGNVSVGEIALAAGDHLLGDLAVLRREDRGARSGSTTALIGPGRRDPRCRLGRCRPHACAWNLTRDRQCDFCFASRDLRSSFLTALIGLDDFGGRVCLGDEPGLCLLGGGSGATIVTVLASAGTTWGPASPLAPSRLAGDIASPAAGFALDGGASGAVGDAVFAVAGATCAAASRLRSSSTRGRGDFSSVGAEGALARAGSTAIVDPVFVSGGPTGAGSLLLRFCSTPGAGNGASAADGLVLALGSGAATDAFFATGRTSIGTISLRRSTLAAGVGNGNSSEARFPLGCGASAIRG